MDKEWSTNVRRISNLLCFRKLNYLNELDRKVIAVKGTFKIDGTSTEGKYLQFT
jgi:hypothetical protein